MTLLSTEFWMRGAVDSVPAALQPVAHALLQAGEEVSTIVSELPHALLWNSQFTASPGFHLQHMTGVLDRLFTYARKQQLNEIQLKQLKEEGIPNNTTISDLLKNFRHQIDRSLAQLCQTDPSLLYEPRELGRKKIQVTHAGLLFHAAEHIMRHTGQLIATVRLLPYLSDKPGAVSKQL